MDSTTPAGLAAVVMMQHPTVDRLVELQCHRREPALAVKIYLAGFVQLYTPVGFSAKWHGTELLVIVQFPEEAYHAVLHELGAPCATEVAGILRNAASSKLAGSHCYMPIRSGPEPSSPNDVAVLPLFVRVKEIRSQLCVARPALGEILQRDLSQRQVHVQFSAETERQTEVLLRQRAGVQEGLVEEVIRAEWVAHRRGT